ncbi:MAG: pitrilysin family protein [Myxococcota bacterium]
MLWLLLSIASAASPRSGALDNGVTWTVLERPEASLVAVQHWVGAGAVHEPEGRAGTAHLLEHLLIGSEQGALESTLSPSGGRLNGFTAADYTRYAAVMPPDALPGWLTATADRFQDLTLTAETFERERRVVHEELAQRGRGLSAQVQVTIDAAVYADHPYARILAGRNARLDGLDITDARAFYERHYVPGLLHVVVVGPVDAAEVRDWMIRAYGEIAPAQAPPPIPALDPSMFGVEIVDAPDAAVARVEARMWPLPPATHPDYWALRVALQPLEADTGARLLDLLSDDTAITRVGADVRWRRLGGHLVVTGVFSGTRSQEKNKADQGALVASLADPPWLSDEEIAVTHRRAIRRMRSASWDVQETARWLGWSWRYMGLSRSPSQLASEIASLTPERIRAVWARWITAAKAIRIQLNVG